MMSKTRWRHRLSWAVMTLAVAVSLSARDATVSTAQDASEAAIRLTLLETGRPDPVIDRFGPSTLIEAGGETLLFDGGRGATQRFWQLGIPLSRVGAVFLTHLHSDHTVGLPDLWLTGWLPTPYGRRVMPLGVWGPVGTEAMTTAAPAALLEQSQTARRIVGFHTLPEDAGRIFSRVQPRLAVYSHVVLLSTDKAFPAPDVAELVPRTRTTYDGPLEVGEDLMVIDIGREVRVRRELPRKPGV